MVQYSTKAASYLITPSLTAVATARYAWPHNGSLAWSDLGILHRASVSLCTLSVSDDISVLNRVWGFILRWVRSSSTSLSSADVAISLRSADHRVNWAIYHIFPTKLGIILWPVWLVVPEDTDSQYSHKIKMSSNYKFSYMINIFLCVLTENVLIYHLSKCIYSNDMEKRHIAGAVQNACRSCWRMRITHS